MYLNRCVFVMVNETAKSRYMKVILQFMHAWFKRVGDRMKVHFKDSMESIDALNKEFNPSQE